MTHQKTAQILIVDDNEAICKTLSAIIQAEGYQTSCVTTAREAIEKTRTKFFDLALLDIKLPDMEGTQLLAQMQETTPETIEIMLTGYPSLQNAIEALNLGADSYIMKPINPEKLLKTIKNKLEKQRQTEKINKEKLARWIHSQARKKSSSNFLEFLEETANELADFGLTKTQAKAFITLNALGFASVSEISAVSKIRREEIYRTMPKLEKHGIVIRKLKTPMRFSTIQPEKAIQILIRNRLEDMKEEMEKIRQKEAELVSKLKTIELPTQQENYSIEVIPKSDNLIMRITNMTQKTKRKIDAATSLEILKYGYIDYIRSLKRKIEGKMKVRMITANHESKAFTQEIIQYSQEGNSRFELRQVEELPFTMMIVDDNEAIWRGLHSKSQDVQSLWTNDPTQICILKAAFENLWQQSSDTRLGE